jgi:hypothetical protein
VVTDFNCEITYNAQKSAPILVSVAAEKSPTLFLDNELFEMKLTRVKGNQFELEIYDREKPTRAYSRARIEEAGDTIGYTLWEREALLEVDCVSLPALDK